MKLSMPQPSNGDVIPNSSEVGMSRAVYNAQHHKARSNLTPSLPNQPHGMSAAPEVAPPLPDVAGTAQPFALDTHQPHGWAALQPLPAMFALNVLSQLLLRARHLHSRVHHTASQAHHRQAQQSAEAALQETRGNRSSALWNCGAAVLGASGAIVFGGVGAFLNFIPNDRGYATVGAALNASAQASSQVINSGGNALDTYYGGKHTADVARNAKEVSKYYEQLAQGTEDGYSRGSDNAQKSFQSVMDAMRSLADMRSQTAREIATNLRGG